MQNDYEILLPVKNYLIMLKRLYNVGKITYKEYMLHKSVIRSDKVKVDLYQYMKTLNKQSAEYKKWNDYLDHHNISTYSANIDSTFYKDINPLTDENSTFSVEYNPHVFYRIRPILK